MTDHAVPRPVHADNEHTRSSPAAARTVSVLDFFADHPGDGFTLTQIARTLRMSPATCLSILAALLDAGYLVRDNRKHYAIGPALDRLALSAANRAGPLERAKPVMRALADRFDVICSAIFADGQEAIVRERASSLSHLGWAAQLGHRFPLSPPFGTVFYAWSSPREIANWTARAASGQQIDSARIEASLAFAKATGFAMGVRTEPLRSEAHAQSLTYRTDKTDYLAAELDNDKPYDLAFVSAPVFDAAGQVSFALALMGFVRAVTGQEIREIGQVLRASCDSISRAAGKTA